MTPMPQTKDFRYAIWWNLLLLTVGAAIFAVGVNGAIVPHGFITGGVMGFSLLCSYGLGGDPSLWLIVINIPLFLVSWIFVSRRFCLFSMYGMLCVSFFVHVIDINLGLTNQLYSAIVGAVICGGGIGIALRSLGSSGGLDVIMVAIHKKFGIGHGKTNFAFNAFLFACALWRLEPDLVVVSMIQVYLSSIVLDSVVSLFNQRKMAFIISDAPDAIADDILHKLHRGATFLTGKGAYSGQNRPVLLTVINNIQLKRLEEIVFTHDIHAMFIVENTFNVMGRGFGKRILY